VISRDFRFLRLEPISHSGRARVGPSRRRAGPDDGSWSGPRPGLADVSSCRMVDVVPTECRVPPVQRWRWRWVECGDGETDAELAVWAAAGVMSSDRCTAGPWSGRPRRRVTSRPRSTTPPSVSSWLSCATLTRRTSSSRRSSTDRVRRSRVGTCWSTPLCGTRNYAAGTPLVAVKAALRGSSGVGVAACADPFAGEVFVDRRSG